MKLRVLLFLGVFLYAFQAKSQCISGQSEVIVTIVPDTYPQESSWTLNDVQTNALLAQGGAVGDTVCIPDGVCVRFDMHDSYGDGMCCGYGNGSYSVTLNGTLVATGGQFQHDDITYFNCPPGYSCTDAITVVPGQYSAPVTNFWYVFTPDSTGAYEITTCNLNDCNTKIWVYDQCTGLTWDDTNMGTIFYDDNDGGCGFQAVVTAYLAAGTTYYIRIGDVGSNCSPNPIVWDLNYTGPISGCMDPASCNYNPLATVAGACIYPGDPLCPQAPDLMVVQTEVQSSLAQDQITAENCYVNEGCLTGYGMRDILRFTTHIKNIGEQDYFIGDPTAHPTQFTYDNCHGHYHYVGYAEYLLYDANGVGVPVGYKNGFCVLDLECSGGGTAQYGCGNMGISTGCGDIYSSGLPCQWIDITDVDTGQYTLVVRVNWDQSPDALGRVESDFSNNWAQVCIRLNRDVNGIPFFNVETNCPVFTDCNGVQFGDAVLDCNGVCGGTAVKGDLDTNTLQQTMDAQLYVSHILNQSIAASTCYDLNANGSITVFDAALINNCALNGAPNNDLCNFPRGIVNIYDTVALSIGNVNLAQNYVDVYIQNTEHKLNAYQFSMSGLQITGVQNLIDPLQYLVSPEFVMNGNEIIGISYQGQLIPKNMTPAPLCRVFFSNLIDTAVCIAKITDIVNENYEATITRIDGNCYQHQFTGIDNKDGGMAYSIFPNPASEVLNVELLLTESDNLNMSITDLTGRIVYNKNLGLTKKGEYRISLSDLASGVYTISIKGKKYSINEKVIVKK